jgi:hypothetical protein
MEQLGMILGFLLLLVKWGSFYLLTGGGHQWQAKKLVWVPVIGWIAYWKFMTPLEREGGVRDWMYSSPVRKGIIDLFAGYLGMHVLAAFGGSIIAMIAMTTYTITCMVVIFLGIIFQPVFRFLSGGGVKCSPLKRGSYRAYSR